MKANQVNINKGKTMNQEKLKEIHNKRYLDSSYKEVKFDNQNNLQFFLSEKEIKGKIWIVGKCFTDKSFNSKWFYRFKDMEQFNKQCLETIENNTSRLESKNKYKEERTKPHTLKVGDVLYCSWGYDQTQVDYFRVKSILGKRKIKIVGLGTSLESDGIHDKATPSDEVGNHWTSDSKGGFGNTLMKYASSNNSVKISSFAYAYKWDGQAKYSTDPMGGH